MGVQRIGGWWLGLSILYEHFGFVKLPLQQEDVLVVFKC